MQVPAGQTVWIRKRVEVARPPARVLGADYGPFRVPYPENAAATVRPPAGMSRRRFRQRYRAYRSLLAASPQVRRRAGRHQEAILRSLDKAYRLPRSHPRPADTVVPWPLTREPLPEMAGVAGDEEVVLRKMRGDVDAQMPGFSRHRVASSSSGSSTTAGRSLKWKWKKLRRLVLVSAV